jgi:hypothetical protein
MHVPTVKIKISPEEDCNAIFRDSDDSSNRRKFLRSATIATGLVVGIPGAASAKNSDSNITNFDPSDNEEIREFALEVRKLPENERQDAFESLSENSCRPQRKRSLRVKLRLLLSRQMGKRRKEEDSLFSQIDPSERRSSKERALSASTSGRGFTESHGATTGDVSGTSTLTTTLM